MWWGPLLALVALRSAVPLLALGASGHDLPGFPAYSYAPLNGDSFAYYAAAREFIATFGEIEPIVLAGLALSVALTLWSAWRFFGRGLRWQAVAIVAVVVSLAFTPVIDRMDVTGAAVFGWSLVWALPMLPYRAVGLPLDPDSAFVFGLALSLAANAVTVVATGFLGLHATGRRSVGLVAASLFAIWPLVTRPLAGASAWENGQWNADVGLHLYTEPISTALVVVALALLLSPRLEPLRLALAGVALAYATFTKLSNGLLAVAAALLVVWWLGPRRALPFVVSGLAVVPLIAVYWIQGYPEIEVVPGWSTEFVARNWSDSLIFGPGVLALLIVPALAGAVVLRGTRALPLLGSAIAVTVGLYSLYEVTWLHPRFLYVALPPLFVLGAAGAVNAAGHSSAGLARRRRAASHA